MADDGNMLPYFWGVETPLGGQVPTGKRAQWPKADVVTVVAPDGSPYVHVGNLDFFTFWRGVQCPTCGQSVGICCNICLFTMHVF